MHNLLHDDEASMIYLTFDCGLSASVADELRQVLIHALSHRHSGGPFWNKNVQLVGWNDNHDRVREIHIRLNPYLSQELVKKSVALVRALTDYYLPN